jgi:hypothetical protein
VGFGGRGFTVGWEYGMGNGVTVGGGVETGTVTGKKGGREKYKNVFFTWDAPRRGGVPS